MSRTGSLAPSAHPNSRSSGLKTVRVTLPVAIALVALGAGAIAGDAPVTQAAKNEALRRELLAMARADQQASVEIESRQPSDPGGAAVLSGWKGMPERHLARMKEIVAQHGWPGRSLVGPDGAHAAWLLVQHADQDREFQRFCLEQMQLAFEAGEATARDLSFLTDRVLLAEGKPQMYGTQGAVGTPTPEEEARIDANRLALGLEPWRVFIEQRRKSRGPWLPEATPQPTP